LFVLRYSQKTQIHSDEVCTIFDCISQQIHRVTTRIFRANHSRQLADNLPETPSGLVKATLFQCSVQQSNVEAYYGTELHFDVIFRTALNRDLLLS
jgi:adenine-specific DNA methylase